MKTEFSLIAITSVVLAVPFSVHAADSNVTNPPSISTGNVTAEVLAPYVPPERRFWRATGEMIIIGYSPWVWSHYVKDYEYANISINSVQNNFKNGFWWDQDNFQTNMWGHPFQGSIYYNAARENGYNFWESSLFTLVGDTGWEFLMEAEQPAYNDMVNTWIGGTNRGEITYRLSNMVLDNRATGSERFWRELGAGFLNPVGFFDRMIFGDMWKRSENPPDRLPSSLFMMVDGGWSHGRENSAHPNQGYATLTLRYNDPHEVPIKKPFDYFEIEGTMSTTGDPLIPWITYRGLLAGWDLQDDADVHHMVAPALTFNYFNNNATAFGGSGLDLMLMSRWKLDKEYELRTEIGGQGYVAAGIQTDHSADSVNATGRNYDFGSGGGPKMDIRLRRYQVDWLRCTVAAGWFPTNNGISSQSRLFLVNTEARYPIVEDLFGGVGWAFQDRYTLYNHLPPTTRTNSEIKVFLSWAFRIIE